MKSVRRNCFETNSSSTHSITLRTEHYQEVPGDIPRNKTLCWGPQFISSLEKCFFIMPKGTIYYKGFENKLFFIIALFAAYYDNYILEVNYKYSEDGYKFSDKFKQSIHYLWIVEWLKKEVNCELILEDFDRAGLYSEDLDNDGIFELLEISQYFKEDFFRRLSEIMFSDCIFEFYNEIY